MTGSFAARLARHRQDSGLSQALLARRAGCTRQYIAQLERGERARPSAEVAHALARALELAGIEREVFLLSAGLARPDTPPAPTPPMSRVAVRMLERLPLPALLHGGCWRVGYVNPPLTGTFSALGIEVGAGASLLALAFAPRLRPHFPDWEPWVRRLVAQFKRDSAPLCGTPAHHALLQELRPLPDFRHIWQSTDPADERLPLLPLDYRQDGQHVTFTISRLQFVETPHLWGVVLLPESAAARALVREVECQPVASPAGTNFSSMAYANI